VSNIDIMNLKLYEPSLVLLIGVSGSGKSTFARRHFRPTEVISSDYCRALVCDDEADQSATKAAFEILYLIASRRLARRRLTVIDATNVLPSSRQPLIRLAKRHGIPLIAIVFDLSEETTQRQNLSRANRTVAPDVIRQQSGDLRRSLMELPREGFHQIYQLSTSAEIENVSLEREPFEQD